MGSIGSAIEIARARLGEHADKVLPLDQVGSTAALENYQTPAFRMAFGHESGMENQTDASILEVNRKDGAKVFVVTGPGRGGPYALMVGGVDLRPQITHGIVCDPKAQVAEVYRAGQPETEKYIGEFGRVEKIIPATRQVLGRQVSRVTLKD